ncbi:MAG: hypothetical protein KF688_17235 [Pirellulales bacterium]|nr:hypothetical protein [Pirellulales bacterium]
MADPALQDFADSPCAAWLDGPATATDLRLRVEFRHVGDRYAHRVVVVASDGQIAPALESLEGADGDPWPESPALQALNRDQLVRAADAGQATVAALVGMSGACHWSLGIEPRSEPAGPGLLFDAACRIKRLPPALGSRYCLAPGAESCAGLGGEVVVTAADGRWRLRLAPVADEPLDCTLDGAQLRIRRPVDPATGLPTTLRWRYAVQLLAPE